MQQLCRSCRELQQQQRRGIIIIIIIIPAPTAAWWMLQHRDQRLRRPGIRTLTSLLRLLQQLLLLAKSYPARVVEQQLAASHHPHLPASLS
jgi:hypothetical protein